MVVIIIISPLFFNKEKIMKKIKIISYLLFLLLSSQAFSFDTGVLENTIKNNSEAEELELIQGIVFDRTITQTGFVFYQEFMRLWRAETSLHQYSITLRETPTARQGSIIWIEQGNTLLHKVVISLRNQQIQKKSESSLKAIRPKLTANRLLLL